MAHGADQREIALIGAGENQPPVGVLEHIDVVAIEQPPDHDLAHLHQAKLGHWLPQYGFGNGRGPGPGRIDERARRDHLAMAAIDRHQPPDLAAFGAGAARAGADHGAPRRGIDGAQHHQPGIVDDAVGIFERGAERPLQRIADRMMGDVDGRGRRQTAARGQPVVQQQPRPQLPRRAFIGMGGDRKAHRTYQMRRDREPDVALGQRATDAKEGPAFQPCQIAVDQPWRGLGCARAEIALLQQDHAQAAAGGVARDADAVQPAADDREIVIRHTQRLTQGTEVHHIYPVLREGSMTSPPPRPTRAAYCPIGNGLPMK